MNRRIRVPWTREELDELLPKLEADLAELEGGQAEEVKPLGPMSVAECLDYFWRLLELAKHRPLTESECFLFGQLVNVFQQACWAEARGHKGRCFVIPEDAVQALIDSKKG